MNKRSILLALALCLVTAAAFAGELKTYRFADIPWGIPRAEAAKLLTAAGFNVLDERIDGLANGYAFLGEINGDSFIGIAFYTPDDKLAKIAIAFETTP